MKGEILVKYKDVEKSVYSVGKERVVLVGSSDCCDIKHSELPGKLCLIEFLNQHFANVKNLNTDYPINVNGRPVKSNQKISQFDQLSFDDYCFTWRPNSLLTPLKERSISSRAYSESKLAQNQLKKLSKKSCSPKSNKYLDGSLNFKGEVVATWKAGFKPRLETHFPAPSQISDMSSTPASKSRLCISYKSPGNFIGINVSLGSPGRGRSKTPKENRNSLKFKIGRSSKGQSPVMKNTPKSVSKSSSGGASVKKVALSAVSKTPGTSSVKRHLPSPKIRTDKSASKPVARKLDVVSKIPGILERSKSSPSFHKSSKLPVSAKSSNLITPRPVPAPRTDVKKLGVSSASKMSPFVRAKSSPQLNSAKKSETNKNTGEVGKSKIPVKFNSKTPGKVVSKTPGKINSKTPVKVSSKTPSNLRRSMSVPSIQKSPYHSKCYDEHKVTSPWSAKKKIPAKSPASRTKNTPKPVRSPSTPELRTLSSPKPVAAVKTPTSTIKSTSKAQLVTSTDKAKNKTLSASIGSKTPKSLQITKSFSEMSIPFQFVSGRNSRPGSTLMPSSGFSMDESTDVGSPKFLNLDLTDSLTTRSIKEVKQFDSLSASLITSTPMPGKSTRGNIGAPVIQNASYSKRNSSKISVEPLSPSPSKLIRSRSQPAINVSKSGKKDQSVNLKSINKRESGNKSSRRSGSLSPVKSVSSLNVDNIKKSAKKKLSMLNDVETPSFSHTEFSDSNSIDFDISSYRHSKRKSFSPLKSPKAKGDVSREIKATNSFRTGESVDASKALKDMDSSLLSNKTRHSTASPKQAKKFSATPKSLSISVGNLKSNTPLKSAVNTSVKMRDKRRSKSLELSKVRSPLKSPKTSVGRETKALASNSLRAGESNDLSIALIDMNSSSISNKTRKSRVSEMKTPSPVKNKTGSAKKSGILADNKSPSSAPRSAKTSLQRLTNSRSQPSTPDLQKSPALTKSAKKSKSSESLLVQSPNHSLKQSPNVNTSEVPYKLIPIDIPVTSKTSVGKDDPRVKNSKTGTPEKKPESPKTPKGKSVEKLKPKTPKPTLNNSLLKKTLIKQMGSSKKNLVKQRTPIVQLSKKSNKIKSKSVERPKVVVKLSSKSKSEEKPKKKLSNISKVKQSSEKSKTPVGISSRKFNKKLTQSNLKPRSKSLHNTKSPASSKKSVLKVKSAQKAKYSGSTKKSSSAIKSMKKVFNQSGKKKVSLNKSKDSSSNTKNSSANKSINKSKVSKSSSKMPSVSSSSKKSTKSSSSKKSIKKSMTSSGKKTVPSSRKLSFTSKKEESTAGTASGKPSLRQESKKLSNSQQKPRSKSLPAVKTPKKSSEKSKLSKSAQKPSIKQNSKTPASSKKNKPAKRSRSLSLPQTKAKVTVNQRSKSVGKVSNKATSVASRESSTEGRIVSQKVSLSPKTNKTSVVTDNSFRKSIPSSPSRLSASYITGVRFSLTPDESKTSSDLKKSSKRMSASALTGVSVTPDKSSGSNFSFPILLAGEISPTSSRKSIISNERLSDIKSPVVRNIKRKLDALSRQEALSAAKQLKEEPPKSLDKMKVAALIKCHGSKQGSNPDVSHSGESSPYSLIYNTSLGTELSVAESRSKKSVDRSNRNSFDVSGIAELMATPRSNSIYERETSVRFQMEDDGNNEGILKALDLARKSDLPSKVKDSGPRRSRRLVSSQQPTVYRKTPAKMPLSETRLTEISTSLSQSLLSSAKKNVSFRHSLVKTPPDANRGVKRKSGELSPNLPKSILKRSKRASPPEQLSDAEMKSYLESKTGTVTSTPLPRQTPQSKSRLGRRKRTDQIVRTPLRLANPSTPRPKSQLGRRPKSNAGIFSPETINEEAASPCFSSPAFSELMFNTPSPERSMYSPNQSVKTFVSSAAKTPDYSNDVFDSSSKRKSALSRSSMARSSVATSFEFSKVVTPNISEDAFVSTLKSSSRSLSEPALKSISPQIPEIIITAPSPKLRRSRSAEGTNSKISLRRSTSSVNNLSPHAKRSSIKSTPQMSGVKTLVKSPKLSDKSQPTPDFRGMKKIMKTPNVKETEPACDFTDVRGVRKLMATPKSPRNTQPTPDYRGLKKIMRTPNTKEFQPASDYSDVRGVKQLMLTPKSSRKTQPTPDFRGVRKMMRTPNAKETEPISDYTDVKGVKKLYSSPTQGNTSPIADYSNVVGVKKMFASPNKEPLSDYSNVSGVKKLFRRSGRNADNNGYCDVSGVGDLFIEPSPSRVNSVKKLFDSTITDIKGARKLFLDEVNESDVLKQSPERIPVLTGSRKRKPMKQSEVLSYNASGQESIQQPHSSKSRRLNTSEYNTSAEQSAGNASFRAQEAGPSSKGVIDLTIDDDVVEIIDDGPVIESAKKTRGTKTDTQSTNAIKSVPSGRSNKTEGNTKTTVVLASNIKISKETVISESPKATRRTRGAKKGAPVKPDSPKKTTMPTRRGKLNVPKSESPKKTRAAKEAPVSIATTSAETNISKSNSELQEPVVKQSPETKKTRKAKKGEEVAVQSPVVSKRTRGAKKNDQPQNPGTSKPKATKQTKSADEPPAFKPESPKVTRRKRGAVDSSVAPEVKAPAKTRKAITDKVKESPKLSKRTRGAKNEDITPSQLKSKGDTVIANKLSTSKADSSPKVKRTRGAKKLNESASLKEKSPKATKKTKGTKKEEDVIGEPEVVKSERGRKKAVATSPVVTKQTRGVAINKPSTNTKQDASASNALSPPKRGRKAMAASTSLKSPKNVKKPVATTKAAKTKAVNDKLKSSPKKQTKAVSKTAKSPKKPSRKRKSVAEKKSKTAVREKKKVEKKAVSFRQNPSILEISGRKLRSRNYY